MDQLSPPPRHGLTAAVPTEGLPLQLYALTRARPQGLAAFLRSMAALYELHVYTQAAPQLVRTIAPLTAALPTFSRCINSDGERASAKRQNSRRWLI